MIKERDYYIDFLRAIGLILLIGVHVDAPDWYVPLRSFDVPLMVFVSALCYKPLRGGYLAYARKRFVRLYKPVFIFLTLFFLIEAVSYILFGKPVLNYIQIIGSYLLLNSPSIGYVWIMRVFIIMALAIPLWYTLFQRINWISLCIVTLSLILAQPLIIWTIDQIEWKLLHFALSETIPYLIGYSAIALPAFKIRDLTNRQELATLGLLLGFIILFLCLNKGALPQQYKYPPQSLYILYGLFCSIGLWSFKPLIGKLSFISSGAVRYLSSNSMWVYLWHIIPVNIVFHFSNVFDLWIVRYIFVLSVAIILTATYNFITSKLYNLKKLSCS